MAAVTVLAICAIVAFGATRGADRLVYDTLMRMDARPPRDDIVVVAIDNRSLQALGRWPWPRAIHADLLQSLARYHPKAIAYDVLFVEPSPDDRALAGAVSAAKPVFFPVLLEAPGGNGAAFRATEPVEPIRTAAAALGQANLDFDSDGVVRQIYLSEGDGRCTWLHLMELMRRAKVGAPIPSVLADAHFSPAGPLRRASPMLISFTGPPGHFRTVSLVDVLRGETPPDVLKDKLVLVGATADGLGDRYPTPVSTNNEVISGIELQANVLDSLLGRHLIWPLAPLGLLAFSLAPTLLLLVGFLRLKPAANMYLGLTLAACAMLASLGLFVVARVWAPPTAALAGLALIYPLWSWRRLAAASAYMIEELDAFAREPERLGGSPTLAAGEALDRQMALMRQAIGRARDLRQFMVDTLDGLPDATLVLGPGGEILMTNPAADRLLAPLIGAALVGQPIDRILSVFTRPVLEGAVAEGLIDGEVRTQDGTVLLVREAVFRDADHAPRGRIVRFTDITEITLALHQRDQALQFLSHDMRSPQISILALLAALPSGDAAGRDSVRRVGDYARRTLTLADDFVRLARAQTLTYALEATNLADLLIEAIDALWPQARAKSIDIIAEEVGEAEYLVLADRSLLTRALVNLIDNAIKYSPLGGKVDCRLALSALEGGRVVLTIRDEGCGMSDADLANLFLPFQRGRQGQDWAGGVGLGLSFVRTVVARHAGDISCESLFGVGSTFTLTLPLAEIARDDV